MKTLEFEIKETLSMHVLVTVPDDMTIQEAHAAIQDAYDVDDIHPEPLTDFSGGTVELVNRESGKARKHLTLDYDGRIVAVE